MLNQTPLIFVLLLAGCGSAPNNPKPDAGAASDAGGTGDGGALTQPDLAGSAPCKGVVTFQAARTAMLSSCGGVGPMSCHGRAEFGAGLDLTAANAYKNLVGVAATMAPGKLR